MNIRVVTFAILPVFLIVSCTPFIEQETSSYSCSKFHCEDNSSSVSPQTSLTSYDYSSFGSQSSSTFKDDDSSINHFWNEEVDEKIKELTEKKNSIPESELFCFFTDPHLFLPTYDYSFDVSKFETWMGFLKKVYELSSCDYIVCGGDVLSYGDTYSQACYKLSYFYDYYTNNFENSYYLVGNHDTNYQGWEYINARDYLDSMLNQEMINNILFGGNKSYYKFNGLHTSNYCFDSGIDWDADAPTDYRNEQLAWFANSLLTERAAHINIFIHIALMYKNTVLTEFMSRLGQVFDAYNKRKTITIDGITYNYSFAVGHVDFVQSGHSHKDIESFYCGGVPVVSTRSFAHPDIATTPTFDLVLLDYTHLNVSFTRFGDGEDRTIQIYSE